MTMTNSNPGESMTGDQRSELFGALYQALCTGGWKAVAGVQRAEIEQLKAEVDELIAALKASGGYLMNAAIDLETGTKKQTTLATLNGGLKLVRAAIEKAEGKP